MNWPNAMTANIKNFRAFGRVAGSTSGAADAAEIVAVTAFKQAPCQGAKHQYDARHITVIIS
jgi:hypothetical protein